MKKNRILSSIIGTTIVPATTERFVAKNKFVMDVRNNAKVKISFINQEFLDWFGEKIEEPFQGSVLRERSLLQDSHGCQISEILGQRRKPVVTLTEIYFSMCQMYLANEHSNDSHVTPGKIFQALDINNVPRTIYVRLICRKFLIRAHRSDECLSGVVNYRVLNFKGLSAVA